MAALIVIGIVLLFLLIVVTMAVYAVMAQMKAKEELTRDRWDHEERKKLFDDEDDL